MISSYPYISLLLFSYLAGSIPVGKLVASSYGIDIQRKGSGNIGFANVRRIVGWRAGLVTLAADITKGFVPTLLALYMVDEPFAFIVGVVAIIGHVFPIWLGFRGGKGIATGLGVVLAVQPIAALAGVAVYIISMLTTKVSSHSSLAGLLATLIIGIALAPSTWWQYVVLLGIALWTLRHNLTGSVQNYDT